MFRCKAPDGSQFDKLTVTSLTMTTIFVILSCLS